MPDLQKASQPCGAIGRCIYYLTTYYLPLHVHTLHTARSYDLDTTHHTHRLRLQLHLQLHESQLSALVSVGSASLLNRSAPTGLDVLISRGRNCLAPLADALMSVCPVWIWGFSHLGRVAICAFVMSPLP